MSHIPVLLKETIELLDPKSGNDFIDCTIGGGGHAREILGRTVRAGKLLGIDTSKTAVKNLKKELVEFQDRLILVNDNFRKLKTIAYDHAIHHVSGVLMDLGFSSDELADSRLGLSFKTDGPLDMRFFDEGVTAAEIVNSLSETELTKIISAYGDERYGVQIARAIVRERKHKKIMTTAHLVRVILEAVPREYERGRIHPATRTFQALRIAVNDELGALREALPQAVELLEKGGRLVVISFHSLEDRIVKRFFREQAGKTIQVLTKKPIQASEEETRRNPRSRSAKLRAVEKL